MRQSTFPTTEFQWHPKLHEEWADEYLLLLFLRFRPTYDRTSAVRGLQHFLSAQRILSYSVYEISAPYDVMVRAWVPNAVHKQRLIKALVDSWKVAPRPEVRLALEVTEIVHHWPWQKNAGAGVGLMREPDRDTLLEGKPHRELAQLNALQQMSRRVRGGIITPLEEDEDLEALPTAVQAEELLGEYKGATLLTSPPYEDGIRFISLVEATEGQDDDKLAMLQQSLGNLLNQAQDEPESPEARIWDRSLSTRSSTPSSASPRRPAKNTAILDGTVHDAEVVAVLASEGF